MQALSCISMHCYSFIHWFLFDKFYTNKWVNCLVVRPLFIRWILIDANAVEKTVSRLAKASGDINKFLSQFLKIFGALLWLSSTPFNFFVKARMDENGANLKMKTLRQIFNDILARRVHFLFAQERFLGTCLLLLAFCNLMGVFIVLIATGNEIIRKSLERLISQCAGVPRKVGTDGWVAPGPEPERAPELYFLLLCCDCSYFDYAQYFPAKKQNFRMN